MYFCYQIMFLQSMNYHCNTGHSCNNFVALCADIYETLVSWAEKFPATFSSRLIFELKCSCTKKDAVQHELRHAVMLLKDCQMHLPTTQLMIHSASLLSLTAKVTFLFENGGRELIWLGNKVWSWASAFPDLISCNFYFWGSLEDKVYKTSPHTVEELRNNIQYEITRISNQEHQRLYVFSSCTECFPSGRQHFRHLL
jgi:hypothetical protein